MRRFLVLLVFLGLVPNVCLASEAENQANSFAKHYLSLCMKHINDLEGLRAKLKNMPKLHQEKADLFLSDYSGDAWPVPDKHGTFVLALPIEKSLCALHARRADTITAEKLFLELVENAPSPLVSKQTMNKSTQTVVNGPTHTISYEWSAPNAKMAMLFTLTTASSNNAKLQVLGTTAIVRK